MSIMDYFEDMDQLFNDIFDLSKIDAELEKLHNKDSKEYRISYRYETGMKEPEVIIKGDVDEKTVKKFLKDSETKLSTSHLTFKDKIKGFLGLKDSQSKTEQIKEKEFTLELPGLAKDDLNIELKDDRAILTSKKETHEYNTHIILPFKPKRYEVTADNGLFTLKFFKE